MKKIYRQLGGVFGPLTLEIKVYCVEVMLMSCLKPVMSTHVRRDERGRTEDTSVRDCTAVHIGEKIQNR